MDFKFTGRPKFKFSLRISGAVSPADIPKMLFLNSNSAHMRILLLLQCCCCCCCCCQCNSVGIGASGCQCCCCFKLRRSESSGCRRVQGHLGCGRAAVCVCGPHHQSVGHGEESLKTNEDKRGQLEPLKRQPVLQQQAAKNEASTGSCSHGV